MTQEQLAQLVNVTRKTINTVENGKYIPSTYLALKLSEALFNNGINAQPILHPAVEEDKTRIRFFMTSSHTPEQVKYTVETTAREWQTLLAERHSVPVR